MIEIYQLNRLTENKQLKSAIMINSISSLSTAEFEDVYFKAGEYTDKINRRQINKVLDMLYDREKTVTYGLFGMGDMVVIDGVHYIYYDPNNWKPIEILSHLEKKALKAPKGGVTIQGTFYPGGRWIPGDVQDDMTEDEKQAVEEGKDSGTVDSEGDGKQNPKADKPPKKPDKKQIEDRIKKGEILKDPIEMDIAIKEGIKKKYSKFEMDGSEGEFYTDKLQLEDNETKEEFISRVRAYERYLLEKGEITTGYGTESSQTKIEDNELNAIITANKSRKLSFKLSSAEKLDLRKEFYKNTTAKQRGKIFNNDKLEIAPSIEAFRDNPEKYYIPGINDPLPAGFQLRNEIDRGYIYLDYEGKQIGQISAEESLTSEEMDRDELLDAWEQSMTYVRLYNEWFEEQSDAGDLLEYWTDEVKALYDVDDDYQENIKKWVIEFGDTDWEWQKWQDEYEYSDEYNEDLKKYVSQWASTLTTDLIEQGHLVFDEYSEEFNQWVDDQSFSADGEDGRLAIGIGEVHPKLRGLGLYSFVRRELFQYADENGMNVSTTAAPKHYMSKYVANKSNALYHKNKQSTITQYYGSFGESIISGNSVVRLSQD